MAKNLTTLTKTLIINVKVETVQEEKIEVKSLDSAQALTLNNHLINHVLEINIFMIISKIYVTNSYVITFIRYFNCQEMFINFTFDKKE